MTDLLEIRWHGRGGQGAKTAAMLLAEIVSAAGKFIQGFPEYGPERMGAPVLAYNRISNRPISLHCQVTNPGVVVVLDATLLETQDVAEGVPEDGIILINTQRSPAEMRRKLDLEGRRLYTVDADQISLETLGKPIPNTPMIGALMKVTALMDYEPFIEAAEAQLKRKFATKPHLVPGNVDAVRRAYREVKSE